MPEAEQNEWIAELLPKHVPFVVGDGNDLISRYVTAAKTYQAQNVVRITGDCPFVPNDTLAFMISTHVANRVDFTTNVWPVRTYPDGSDIEILSIKGLDWLDRMAHMKRSDREHVMPYAYDNWHKLSDYGLVGISVKQPIDYSHIKTSIDTVEDLARVEGMMTKQ